MDGVRRSRVGRIRAAEGRPTRQNPPRLRFSKPRDLACSERKVGKMGADARADSFLGRRVRLFATAHRVDPVLQVRCLSIDIEVRPALPCAGRIDFGL